MNFLKKKLTVFFTATLGIFVRSVQRSLISSDVTVIKLLMHESKIDSVKYAKKYLREGIILNTREEIWEYCSKINQVRNGPIIEFGVHKGVSINYFAKLNPDLEIFGFDSFEGLSENWYGGRALKGSISNHGALPKVKDNVVLIKGWYKDSLPNFLPILGNRQIGILHLDSDTFSPTKFVLNSLSRNIRPGTIIIFDEFFGYPNFEFHEFKAWQQFKKSSKLKFHCIGFSEFQVAFQVI